MSQAFFRIEPNAPTPLYQQVQHGIVEGIRAGAFDSSRRLPSTRELAEELEVSRNTVNLAYQELIAQGFLVTYERMGTFVTPGLTASKIAQFQGRTHPGSLYSAEEPHPHAATGVDWEERLAHLTYTDDFVEVHKPADWHTAEFPFLPGQVELSHFPARAWTRCLREAHFQPHLTSALSDAAGFDDARLIEAIRTRLLPSRGVEAEPEEIMITVGAQQALSTLTRALLPPGSTVLMENPGYADYRNIAALAEADVRPLAVDADGACPPASLDGAGAVYLTPSHQNPTNVTLTLERRHEFLRLAAQAGTVIIEDDYDAEFRYAGQPSPSLKALDRAGHVIHIGSFSKFLAPGLRLGFLVGPAPLVRVLRKLTKYTLRNSSAGTQRAMALFIESGDYHRTLRRNRQHMRMKWQAMQDGLERFLPWSVPPEGFPTGGTSMWIQGPAELDAAALQQRAAQAGVLIELGATSFLRTADAPGNLSPAASFRLGYAPIPLARIPEGLRRLGECAEGLLD